MSDMTVHDGLEDQERTGSVRDDGLSFEQFGRIADEIRLQPDWRNMSDRCADYYDGNQDDPETLADLESKGMGPLTTNLIKPTINVVLGMEAMTRSDWRVVADSDEWQEVAEAQSAKLHEAERETRADRACSDAYASQIKSGIGWVEVGRNADPFKYPYRASNPHRREIYWDWLAKEPDLSDARYLVRQRWHDTDELIAYMPHKASLIKAAGMGWPAFWLDRASESVELATAYQQEGRTSLAEYEWRDTSRERVCLFETWYRRFVRGYVIRLPDGRTVELNMKNPVHVAAVGRGLVKPKPAVYSKLRTSIWLGPHKLIDRDAGTRRLPYIPFWGYREDLTGVPYGLIRDMLSPQDEVNARARKLLWLLSAKRLRIDSDALDKRHNDISDVLRELARPDAVVVTDPNRRNANALEEVDNNLGLSEQQFRVMEERKKAIQEVAGVYNALMGRESGTTANSALQTLIERGSTSLAEINDNQRYARRLVGEVLLELVNEDMAGQPVEVVTGDTGRRKTISLNKPAIDEQTRLPMLQNDVTRAQTKVALEDVPSSPAYRAQQQTMLAEVMKSLPPNLQAVIAPFYLESTELPKRREIADLIRKVMGMGEEGQDPEKAQLMQKIQELMQQLQEVQQSPALKESAAKIEEILARAAKTRAEARKTANEVEAQERAEQAMGIPANDPIEQIVERMVFAE